MKAMEWREPVRLIWITLQTVQKGKLGKVITHLSEERMQEVFEAVKFAFGFDK